MFCHDCGAGKPPQLQQTDEAAKPEEDKGRDGNKAGALWACGACGFKRNWAVKTACHLCKLPRGSLASKDDFDKAVKAEAERLLKVKEKEKEKEDGVAPMDTGMPSPEDEKSILAEVRKLDKVIKGLRDLALAGDDGIESLAVKREEERDALKARLKELKPLGVRLREAQVAKDKSMRTCASLEEDIVNLGQTLVEKKARLQEETELFHKARSEAARLAEMQAVELTGQVPAAQHSPEPRSLHQWAAGMSQALGSVDPAMAADFHTWMEAAWLAHNTAATPMGPAAQPAADATPMGPAASHGPSVSPTQVFHMGSKAGMVTPPRQSRPRPPKSPLQPGRVNAQTVDSPSTVRSRSQRGASPASSLGGM